MHAIVLMHIFDGGQTLTKKLEGLGLGESLLLVLVVKQSAVLGQFHDHVDGIILYESVPKFDDVRVVDTGVQIDLPLEQKQLAFTAIFAQIDLNNIGTTTLTA